MSQQVIVENALENKEVVISMTLVAGEGSPWTRKMLLTVGLPDEKVVMRAGLLSEFQALVDDAWGEYSQISSNKNTAVTEPEEKEELASVQAEFNYSDDDF